MRDAWTQIFGFVALLMAAWLCASMDHAADVDAPPLRFLHERQAWAARIDPGVALAKTLAR